MELEILQIHDVTEMLRVSEPTVRRWLAESRAGRGTFPLPFSQGGRKLLWDGQAIRNYCQSRTAPATLPGNVLLPAKQERLKKQQREQTAARLATHGITLPK